MLRGDQLPYSRGCVVGFDVYAHGKKFVHLILCFRQSSLRGRLDDGDAGADIFLDADAES